MNLVTDTFMTVAPSMNVLATTLNGDPTQTIVVGSHLDSVPAGISATFRGYLWVKVLESMIMARVPLSIWS
jgi:acetylornithine deacetylase/succinyl-diaminopimelate desuccinylase-like protein